MDLNHENFTRISGEFTPCITNSWANSKIFIKLYNLNFRSSWEAYFYIFMKTEGYDIQYEKLRIPYLCSEFNKIRSYITDFIDENSRILYEIKPNCNVDEQNTKDKEEYALKWCEENKYSYIFITEDWFSENYNVELIDTVDIDDKNRVKLKRLLKQFERK